MDVKRLSVGSSIGTFNLATNHKESSIQLISRLNKSRLLLRIEKAKMPFSNLLSCLDSAIRECLDSTSYSAAYMISLLSTCSLLHHAK
jgi:hypothetical protein